MHNPEKKAHFEAVVEQGKRAREAAKKPKKSKPLTVDEEAHLQRIVRRL